MCCSQEMYEVVKLGVTQVFARREEQAGVFPPDRRIQCGRACKNLSRTPSN